MSKLKTVEEKKKKEVKSRAIPKKPDVVDSPNDVDEKEKPLTKKPENSKNKLQDDEQESLTKVRHSQS